MKSIDGQFTLVGRYTQLLVDGSPMVMDAITRELKKDKMVLSTTHFNVKDFYSYAEEYKKPVMSQIDTTSRKREVAKKIAILKENGG